MLRELNTNEMEIVSGGLDPNPNGSLPSDPTHDDPHWGRGANRPGTTVPNAVIAASEEILLNEILSTPHPVCSVNPDMYATGIGLACSVGAVAGQTAAAVASGGTSVAGSLVAGTAIAGICTATGIAGGEYIRAQQQRNDC